MSKIDITKIDGYREDMTPDEKIALLLSYELPTASHDGFIAKTVFDKTASELAEAKKQLKTKMTEDEQKEAERLANEAAMKSELENLRREKTLSAYKANYLSLGYDEELATKTAEAMADGKTEEVFASQKVFLEAQKQALLKQALEGTPRPPASDKNKITPEQLDSMSDEDYYKTITKKE